MNKFEIWKAALNNELAYAEQSIESARKNVLLSAENGTADEIIAWANNKKRAETMLAEVKAKLEVVNAIEEEMEA